MGAAHGAPSYTASRLETMNNGTIHLTGAGSRRLGATGSAVRIALRERLDPANIHQRFRLFARLLRDLTSAHPGGSTP
ncbi:hypothetical protein B7486_14125 [cyanobacterium TDX16]|nr:hypothetical protein B7486_14125 [cyanobacterium TDX16]